MDTKSELVQAIKKIIDEFGSFSFEQIGKDNSRPEINKNGSHWVADMFRIDVVLSLNPQDFLEEKEFMYEDLSENELREILRIAQDFEADELLTQKRCSD